MTLEEVIVMATKNNRICPRPPLWATIHQGLTKDASLAEQLPLPLILAGWAYSSDAEKQSRFRLHLEFADRHGLLELVEQHIKAMAEEDWHHLGQ